MNDNELIKFAIWIQNENYFLDNLGKDHAGHKKGELLWMKECEGQEILILKTNDELLKEYKND